MKSLKQILAILLSIAVVFSTMSLAFADSTVKGYLVLGSDLSDSEKSTVLKLLNVDDVSQYSVSYTTNKQEHQAFDDYMSSSVIGTRALSSILMIPKDENSGIHVTTYNINYCTVEMYQNALISAGVSDVDIYIAAPVSASGTCALLSAMNAYSTMTGDTISSTNQDAAVTEIVTTGEIGDTIGDNDTAAELIAVLKQQVLSSDLSEAEISSAIDKACEQMDIDLSESDKQKLVDLLEKLKNADIDFDALANQATDLYNKVSSTMQELGITKENVFSFLAQIFHFLANFFDGLLK